MGQFKVSLTVHPKDGSDARQIDALVDSGAAYSRLPRPLLETLGYRPIRQQPVILADGRIEEWPLTVVDVECAGRRMPTPILGGPPDGPPLLGATTLEELGFGIDPLARRLIPIDVYMA